MKNSQFILKSENVELINKRKNNKNYINKRNKKNLKSSLNMSINSNNKFLNSKSEHQINSEENDKKTINQKREKEDLINNKKDILSSISDDNNINESFELNDEKNCFYFYLKYFIQREIFLTSFYYQNINDNIPYFIRISTIISVMSFIFMINCLLLTSSDIHKRYLFAKENKGIKEFKYVFNHEFLKVFLCALISNIVKIICIKFIYGKYLFKIPSKLKEGISTFVKGNINKEGYLEIYKKRKKYIKKYWEKSIIFTSIVIALLLFFGYISACYVGTFPNTFAGIILRYFLSIILSFIICAFICFIIVVFYHFGFLSCYNFIKKIY
jgi:hypothetical protein